MRLVCATSQRRCAARGRPPRRRSTARRGGGLRAPVRPRVRRRAGRTRAAAPTSPASASRSAWKASAASLTTRPAAAWRVRSCRRLVVACAEQRSASASSSRARDHRAGVAVPLRQPSANAAASAPSHSPARTASASAAQPVESARRSSATDRRWPPRCPSAGTDDVERGHAGRVGRSRRACAAGRAAVDNAPSASVGLGCDRPPRPSARTRTWCAPRSACAARTRRSSTGCSPPTKPAAPLSRAPIRCAGSRRNSAGRSRRRARTSGRRCSSGPSSSRPRSKTPRPNRTTPTTALRDGTPGDRQPRRGRRTARRRGRLRHARDGRHATG